MRAKRALIGAGVAVLAAVGVALVAPSLIDWNDHRAMVAERLQRAAGRPVTIGGDLSMALLPVPHLSARDIRIANVDGASDAALLHVDTLDLRLKLWPLLGGRFDIESLVLIHPSLNLERLADGRVNWALGAGAPAGPAVAPSAAAVPSSPVAVPAGIPESRIARLVVEKGVLVYRRPNAAPLRLDGVDGTFAIAGLTYRVDGRARLEGVGLTFGGVLDRVAGREPAAATLSLGIPETGIEAKAGGTLAPALDRFSGKLLVKTGDLSRLGSALGPGAPRLPRVPLTLEAKADASAQKIALDEIAVTLAEQSWQGSAGLVLSDVPRADVHLRTTRLDLDALAAKLPPAPPPAPATPSPKPSASQDGGAGGTAAPSAPPLPGLPRNIAVAVNLGADFVTWRGGLLRDARLNAQLENGEILVNQAGVGLPGDSDLSLFGFVSSADDGPVFEGTFEGGTDNLRTLLAWVGVETPRLPPDRLRALKLSGNLRARPRHVVLEGVKIRLDGSRAEAALDLRLEDRPAFGLTFAVDVLNGDAYWPPRTPPAAAPAPTEAAPTPAKADGAAPPADAGAVSGLPKWLDGVDANVRGRIGQLVARGVAARDVTVDAALVDGRLDLHDLVVADLGGAEVRLTGGVALAPLAFHGLRGAVHAPALDNLLNALGVVAPFDLSHVGALALTGSLDGPAADVAFDGRAEVAGTALAATGHARDKDGAATLDADLQASHSSLTSLVRLVRPSYRPRGTLGAFAVQAHASGGWDALALSDLRLKLGPVTAAGDGRLALTGRPRVDLRLTADQIPVDPFLPAQRAASASPWHEMIANGLLIPSKGVPSGGFTLASASRYEPPSPQAAPRPKVETGDIGSRWSNDPLPLDALGAVDGTVALDARAVTFGGTRFDNAGLTLRLGDGVATLDHFDGQLYGGRFESSGRLDGGGALAFKASLAHARMQEALLGLAGLNFAEGTGDATMSVATNGRSVAEMVGHLSGSAKVAVAGGVLKGFDLAAVSARAGEGGLTGLLGLIEAGLDGGSTRFSSLKGTFHAANGLITTDDLTLVAEGGGARAAGAVNLPAYVMDTHADFHIDGVKGESPPLVMRISGPLDHPRRFVDINAIQTWLARHGVAAPTGKVKAKDVVKGLLKGIR